LKEGKTLLKLQAFFVQCPEERFDLRNHFLQVIGELAGDEDCTPMLATGVDQKRGVDSAHHKHKAVRNQLLWLRCYSVGTRRFWPIERRACFQCLATHR
jgi:hypothetical protein